MNETLGRKRSRLKKIPRASFKRAVETPTSNNGVKVRVLMALWLRELNGIHAPLSAKGMGSIPRLESSRFYIQRKVSKWVEWSLLTRSWGERDGRMVRVYGLAEHGRAWVEDKVPLRVFFAIRNELASAMGLATEKPLRLRDRNSFSPSEWAAIDKHLPTPTTTPDDEPEPPPLSDGVAARMLAVGGALAVTPTPVAVTPASAAPIMTHHARLGPVSSTEQELQGVVLRCNNKEKHCTYSGPIEQFPPFTFNGRVNDELRVCPACKVVGDLSWYGVAPERITRPALICRSCGREFKRLSEMGMLQLKVFGSTQSSQVVRCPTCGHADLSRNFLPR